MAFQQQTVTVTQTMVESETATHTRDVTKLVTATDLVTKTRVWTSTETQDRTKLIEHTLTATDVVTSVATMTQLETATATETDTVQVTNVITKQEVSTVLQPTTYVSVWQTTVTNDRLETVVETRSRTVTDTATHLTTVSSVDTVTKTATALETQLVPTTYVRVWTTTKVNEENSTVEETLTSTVVSTQTREVTATETATETTVESRVLAETALSSCRQKKQSTSGSSGRLLFSPTHRIPYNLNTSPLPTSMSTRKFEISALSPVLEYDPQQDVTNSVWKSDQGGLQNGNSNSGNPTRVLHGSGSVKIKAFGSGLSFSGSIQGVYCTYTATLLPGEGNTASASSAPTPQTAPPENGMLASFTGLDNANWELELKGQCGNGSMIKIATAVVEGWDIKYSGNDWSITRGLEAAFYDDSQHYTSVNGAVWNVTFQGSAVVVWASSDPSHGPYSAQLVKGTQGYNSATAIKSTGYNTFLAVPLTYFFATGLDPSQTYTLYLENNPTNGTYLDLDSIEIYTSTGSGPPNGGSNLVVGGGASKNNAAIIGGAVGGGVGLLLLLLLAFFLWRRRKNTKKSKQNISPIDYDEPKNGPHVIPFGQSAGVPTSHPSYSSHPTYSSHPNPAPESQALLHSPRGAGTSFSPTTNTMSMSGTSATGFDPYAAFGGGYSTPTASSVAALNDPVQARRQGKAAEIQAARMRVANHGSVASPITPHPVTTHSTITQSWENLSTHVPSSSDPPGNETILQISPSRVKTPEPDEPPPSYTQ
ncbi:12136_t:CDS:2 [Acaulospora colombiana]|uniref:12136_t:CDS:1 n=1 Tax=Acaulospora colombiana TaxID=27376 RepID=A0ACA9MJH0_9GLOM|nr:12136_t:CDS:2 [Acaulospora colombiana]